MSHRHVTSCVHFAAVGAQPGLVTSALVMQDDAVSSDRVQGSVLEPCRIGVEMKMKNGTGDFNLSLSDLKLNLAPDIFELVQSLQSSVLEPLVQPPPDRSAGHGILFLFPAICMNLWPLKARRLRGQSMALVLCIFC